MTLSQCVQTNGRLWSSGYSEAFQHVSSGIKLCLEGLCKLPWECSRRERGTFEMCVFCFYHLEQMPGEILFSFFLSYIIRTILLHSSNTHTEACKDERAAQRPWHLTQTTWRPTRMLHQSGINMSQCDKRYVLLLKKKQFLKIKL